MTETAEKWPNLLEVAAAHVRYAGDPSLAAKLRRLASLLEQITPEMAKRVWWADVKQTSAPPADLLAFHDALRALAATPSEETD